MAGKDPTLRPAIEAAVEAHETRRSAPVPNAEPPPPADEVSHWPHWLPFGRFSWRDLAVFVVSEGVAVPLCIAAGDAFVHRDWIGTAIGWGPGLPLLVFGAAFPFSRHWIKPETAALIQKRAINWAPVVALLAFAYVVGPNIYRRAIVAEPLSTPTAMASTTNAVNLSFSGRLTIYRSLLHQGPIIGLKPQPPGPWNFLLTSNPENQRLRDELAFILKASMNDSTVLMAVPWSSNDLDAPKLENSNFSGVTLHGDTNLPINERLEVLSNCFVFHKTSKSIPGIEKYLKSDNFTWIEIGPGTPWIEPFPKSCLE
jgi:hypothetical protein